MHQIAFDLKRCHLKTLAYGEKVLRGVPGMTGARFDLLVLVREKNLAQGTTYGRDELTTGIPQRELWQRLDLDRSTISKMLTRLEEMGWIRREREKRKDKDWRTKTVFLTATGLRHIAKAMRIMFRGRALLKYFERIYKLQRPYKYKHAVRTLFDMSRHLEFIADAFGDRSIVHYECGIRLSAGPLEMDFRRRRAFHPLYVPPPAPKQAPKPLVGDQRQPTRPFGFTDYENALRRVIWNEEKRRPRRARVVPTTRSLRRPTKAPSTAVCPLPW